MKKGGRKHKTATPRRVSSLPFPLHCTLCPCVFLVVPELRNACFQMTLIRRTRRSFLCRTVPATAARPAVLALARDQVEDDAENENETKTLQLKRRSKTCPCIWCYRLRGPSHGSALSVHRPLLPEAAPEPVLAPSGNLFQVSCSGGFLRAVAPQLGNPLGHCRCRRGRIAFNIFLWFDAFFDLSTWFGVSNGLGQFEVFRGGRSAVGRSETDCFHGR